MKELDDSYVVWTSYYTREEKTSYESFHNGVYDMELRQGIQELERRSGREISINEIGFVNGENG